MAFVPPPADEVEAWARATWPDDQDTAVRILSCESKRGQDTGTYDLEASNGGPMQLNRYTWEPYFRERYGWTWEQVVTDLPTHFAAAREVYDRSSGWGPWTCYGG